MQPSCPKGASTREDLRLHSRYIRDTLVPILSKHPKLSHSDSVCLRAILKTLDTIPMTLDLLRYSRIEKALMVIAATGNACWPMDISMHAEELIAKWEDNLGPLKNLRADLYGLGGRMEGVRKITWKDERVIDDEAKSAWCIEGAPNPSRAHAFGHLGFEVGEHVLFLTIIPVVPLPNILSSWWVKPAAAYRDGIIDETSHGITANEHGAYAIVLTGSCEVDLGREREIRYKATINDPGVFKLTKTMLREDPEEKVVRVLRSWKLRSKIAPKAGLRYDGLYQILSFSVHLLPPNTWHTAFTLSRLPGQPSLLPALHIPTSDQLDDWKDYQRSKLVDRGDDFAVLRDILSQRKGTNEGEIGGEGGDGENVGRHGFEESGYFSRRSSKAISTTTSGGVRNSFPTEELEEMAGDIEIEMENHQGNDEGAEEADDEATGLEEDLEDQSEDENNKFDQTQAKRELTPYPTIQTQTLSPEHGTNRTFQLPHIKRIGTRFISARKTAEPRVSADEAVGGRPKGGGGRGGGGGKGDRLEMMG